MSYIAEAWEKELYEDKYIPSDKNTASKMGYECIKRLVLERTAPELKKPFTLEAIGKMAEGTEQEKQIRGWITLNPGTDIIRSQEPFEFEKLQLKGHFEGILEKKNEEPILFEIKTTERYTFDSLYTIEDFYKNRWWLGYLKQVTVYAKAAKMDRVLFIVKDRASRKPPKEFIYEVDESIWTAIKKKCRTVNAFVRRNKIPSDEHCDFSECGNDRNGCPFFDYCQPSMVQINEGYEQVLDDEIYEKITRYLHIRSLVKEKDEISDYLKSRFNKEGTGINAYVLSKDPEDEDPIYEIKWSERNGKNGKTFAMNVGEL